MLTAVHVELYNTAENMCDFSGNNYTVLRQRPRNLNQVSLHTGENQDPLDWSNLFFPPQRMLLTTNFPIQET